VKTVVFSKTTEEGRNYFKDILPFCDYSNFTSCLLWILLDRVV